MAEMVMGVFSTRDGANGAINELESKGYNPKDMSVMTREVSETHDAVDSTGDNVAEGAITGATTGAALGGIAGLLIGIGAIALPGIGGLLIGGPIAAALGLTGAAATTVSGATTGAVAGGLVGALTGLGVPEEDARVYEEQIKRGGTFVMVPTRTNAADEAVTILSSHGAQQVKTTTVSY